MKIIFFESSKNREHFLCEWRIYTSKDMCLDKSREKRNIDNECIGL